MNYKEKIRLAKEALNSGSYDKETIEYIFPELVESEDERIRGAIIDHLKDNNLTEWAAWIEEQSAQIDLEEKDIWEYIQEFIDKFGHFPKDCDELNVCINYVLDKTKHYVNQKELKFEQKPVDKVEPKFHKGDWVTDGFCKCQIRFIDDTQYWYSENCILGSIESVDKKYHLWTIQDAKEGDIMIVKEWERPFIFKDLSDKLHPESPVAYCGIDVTDNFTVGYGNFWWTGGDICPATKEESEILFDKMKEAGYEWDTEKKELKKIEKKPAWSEEDEEMIDNIIDYMKPMPIFFESTTGKSGKEYTKKFIKDAIKWLKSLQDRVQIQLKQE